MRVCLQCKALAALVDVIVENRTLHEVWLCTNKHLTRRQARAHWKKTV